MHENLTFIYRCGPIPFRKTVFYVSFKRQGDRGPSHVELHWPACLKIVRGIALGMHYLYTILGSSDLPHEYLKSSNVLLGPDNEPMLVDYEFSHMVNPSTIAQTLFAYKAPEAAQQGQYLSNGKGAVNVVQWVETAISEGRESEVLDPKIAGSSNWLGEMEQLLHIGAACTESNPQRRLDMAEAVRRIMEIKFECGHESTSLADSHHAKQSQRRHGTNSFRSWDNIEYGSS
ncbi:Pollen receptor-like kinase 6 [Glycine soja]|uniref:Pollen receptor-like kinase 6 n=2 Tax=Glycine subgen. Soja TaxID=1462606 RepID=A0A445F1I3_GLYSO|nr:Pollen receptor-like kinase 6 [Glycine soja]